MVINFIYISVQFFLGTPDESVWPGVSQLPDYKSSFPKWPQQSISSIVPHLTGEGLDLMAVSYHLSSSEKSLHEGTWPRGYITFQTCTLYFEFVFHWVYTISWGYTEVWEVFLTHQSFCPTSLLDLPFRTSPNQDTTAKI